MTREKSVTVNVTAARLPYHRLSALFPMMDNARLNDLAIDIRGKGLLTPIVIYEGAILDGRNRFEACAKIGVIPQFEDYAGNDPLGFVISQNLMRRHLKETQRSIVAAEVLAMSPASMTVTEASQIFAVSVRSIDSARAVVKSGTEALLEMARGGLVSISAAAHIARLSVAQQTKVITSGPRAVVAESRKTRSTWGARKRSDYRDMWSVVDTILSELEQGNLSAVAMAADKLKRMAAAPGRYEMADGEAK